MSVWRNVFTVIDPHPGEHFKDKLIAVGLALVVWFGVNTQQFGSLLFQGVPVNIVNVPDHLASAAEIADTLTITLSGFEGDLERVSRGLLSPQIDLSGAVAGQTIYQIRPEDLRLPSRVTVSRIDPAEVTISLESKEQRRVPVGPVTSGEPADGYEVVGRATDPDTVLVSGPRSLVAQLERIDTTVVDVRGRTESFAQSVALVANSGLLEIEPRNRTVRLSIDIVERAVSQQFDDVEVVVINNRFQVAVNPQRLGVLVSGPPSLLARLDATRIRLVVDAAQLEPAADDYRIEPVLQLVDGEFEGSVELVALYPQRVIDVHVFQQAAQR